MTTPVPQSAVTLRALVTKDLENDVLRLQFLSEEQGTTPLEVQETLRKNLAEAIAIITPLKKAEEVEVETGSLSVQPLYKKTTIAGYNGSVTLTVYGTDTATIAGLATKIKSMAIYGSGNSLSPKKHKAAETDLIQEAITAFKAKAGLVTKAFGANNYTIGEVDVSASTDSGRRGYGGMRAMSASASLESADGGGGGLDVESGKSTVSASVSGTIVLDGAYAYQTRS